MGNHLTKNQGSGSPSSSSSNNRFTISTPPPAGNNNSNRSVTTTIVRGEFNVSFEQHHNNRISSFYDSDDSGCANDDVKKTKRTKDEQHPKKARSTTTPVSPSKKSPAKRKNDQSTNNETKKKKFSQTKLEFMPSPDRSKNKNGAKPSAAAAASSKANTAKAKSVKNSNLKSDDKVNNKVIKKKSISDKATKSDVSIESQDETEDDERKPAARPTSQKLGSKIRTEFPVQQQQSTTKINMTNISFEKEPEYQRIYRIVKELYKERMDADFNSQEEIFKQQIEQDSSIDSNMVTSLKKQSIPVENNGIIEKQSEQQDIPQISTVPNKAIRIDKDLLLSQNQKRFKIIHHFPRSTSKQQQQPVTTTEEVPKCIIPRKSINKDDYFTRTKFSVHLYSSFAVEDETELNYVPFIDDTTNNHERLGKLLQDYNFDERLKDIEYGGSTMIREYITFHMKGILKDILYVKNPELRQNEQYRKYVFYSLEKIFKLTNVMTDIEKYYSEVEKECDKSGKSDASRRRPNERQGLVQNTLVKNESDQQNNTDETKREVTADNSFIIIDDSDEEEGDSSSSDGCVIIEDTNRHLAMYEKAVSTYRILWCRRCYTFDCNLHGIFHKADLKTQFDINMQRDPTSSLCAKSNMTSATAKNTFWKKADSLFHEKLNEINQSLMMTTSLPAEASIDETGQQNNCDTQDLTTFQKSIIGRVYQIYEGDVDRMAKILRASVSSVQNYLNSFPSEFPTSRIKLKTKLPTRKKKGTYHSMRNYKKSMYEANSKSGIAPFCSPCSHTGVCSEDICNCINNRLFCTMACTINSDSINFFRGCDCAGNCSTKQCTCFLANRECDPDLCVACLTCVDPTYQIELKKQKCNNDRIYMNRAHPVLVGKSCIAGLGLFNKFDLKKGDYVGEYIGEKISQEEADRRGQCYDALNLSYMFALASDVTLDAMRKGNKIRFINHSTQPNLEVKTIFVRGEQRIGFYAKYDIKAQSELFFDYQYNKKVSNDFIEKGAFDFDWMIDEHKGTDGGKATNNHSTESGIGQANKKKSPLKKRKTNPKSAASTKSTSATKGTGTTKRSRKNKHGTK